MHSDAKFGLLVGVILVVAVAVFFFGNEPAETPLPEAATKTSEVKAPPANPSAAAMLPPPAPKSPTSPTSRPDRLTSRPSP
jgi:hypothetical protein